MLFYMYSSFISIHKDYKLQLQERDYCFKYYFTWLLLTPPVLSLDLMKKCWLSQGFTEMQCFFPQTPPWNSSVTSTYWYTFSAIFRAATSGTLGESTGRKPRSCSSLRRTLLRNVWAVTNSMTLRCYITQVIRTYFADFWLKPQNWIKNNQR